MYKIDDTPHYTPGRNKLAIVPTREGTETPNGIYDVYLQLFWVFKKHQRDMNLEERRYFDDVA